MSKLPSQIPAFILDRGLNCAVQHIASRLFPTGFDVGDVAPDTFDSLRDHVQRTGRMLVWSGASDRTIFGDPEINYAFRAWHDWCHLYGNGGQGFPFTREGEAGAVALQQDHLRALYGDTAQTRKWCAILDCEVNGQAQYQAETGQFPADQVAFTIDYLTRKGIL